MKILIIEDEAPAAQRLEKLLKEIEPGIIILDSIVSVATAVKWLSQNPAPDVIISDIQLADGLSFEIFKTVPTLCPIIFTTAFDEYAIKAFESHAVDYLLKPFSKERFDKGAINFSSQEVRFKLDENGKPIGIG